MRKPKPKYDSLHWSKRILLLVEHDRFCVGEAVIKIDYCDQEYVNELHEQAEELLDGLTIHDIKNFIAFLDVNLLDYHSFTEYATDILEKLIVQKLKLYEDECVEYFKIEHETNCCS